MEQGGGQVGGILPTRGQGKASRSQAGKAKSEEKDGRKFFRAVLSLDVLSLVGERSEWWEGEEGAAAKKENDMMTGLTQPASQGPEILQRTRPRRRRKGRQGKGRGSCKEPSPEKVGVDLF